MYIHAKLPVFSYFHKWKQTVNNFRTSGVYCILVILLFTSTIPEGYTVSEFYGIGGFKFAASSTSLTHTWE